MLKQSSTNTLNTKHPTTSSANPLTKNHIQTLALASLGGALEYYDFIIFVFFIQTISQLFFPADLPEWLRQLEAFGIFAAGYLARPLGGILMAHFGDMLGRKRMFMLSVVLMVLPTLLIGLLPTYHSIGLAAPFILLLLRIMQGAAIGGEVPGAWVFVCEHVPHKHTGLACGTLNGGLGCGLLLGSLMATFINSAFSPAEVHAWAWRIPFIAGALLGIIAIYLRRYLHETPVFIEMRAQKTLARQLPLKIVLKEHKHTVVLSILLTWLLTAAVVVLILMMPTYTQKYFGLSTTIALYANNLAICGLMIGSILVGWIVDKIGYQRALIGGGLLLASITTSFYTYGNQSQDLLYLLSFVLGLSAGIISIVPSMMVNAFPAEIRFSGISFSYNLSYAVFGGLTPLIITLWLQLSPMAPSYYVTGVSLLATVIGLLLWKRASRQSIH